MSDFDILVKWMKYNEDEAKKMLSRLKIQKLEDLKLQIIAQNPNLLGIGLPGPDEQQVGSEPGASPPMLGGMPGEGGSTGEPPMGEPPIGEPPMGAPGQPPMGGSPMGPPPGMGGGAAITLPEPEDDELRKYDLEINDYEREMDQEERDPSEES